MSGALEPGGSVRLVLTTCPDESTARRIARTLVEERLIACGNVIPDLSSIYRWRGVIEETGECLLLMKAPAERLAALAERLPALHPYEVPELLVLDVERGAGHYLRWVLEETSGDI
jgi:periplasmic divalent cation tolerance protein